ncbi:uncharacterized protein LOC118411027 [Branchiostoma floridae]|uniref:Uncharacterized protein LOC118411027 n=1 Tax=Branchiostoma floridae TaxID=7739 RepID=A0A9J7KRW4_BRAFL|nr:uncharacterized protein LOC118411027 [Branchiostoma floridae]
MKPAGQIVLLAAILTFAELVTAASPRFLVKPRHQVARLGSAVTFHCRVVGDPQPTLIWTTDNLEPLLFPGGTYGRVKVNTNGDLTISDVQLSDRGEYTCQGINVDGAATAKAKLVVLAKGSETNISEMKTKDRLEPIDESAQLDTPWWPRPVLNPSVGTFRDLATEMHKNKKVSEYVSSLRLVGEHLQRLTGKITALDVHLLYYKRESRKTSDAFQRVLGFINGQSRKLDGEDIFSSTRMVVLSGYIGIVKSITSRHMFVENIKRPISNCLIFSQASKIVHNLNTLGASLIELKREIDDFGEILPPEGLQSGALEDFINDTYECPEFQQVDTPDIPERLQENVNVTLLDFAKVAEHSDRISSIIQEARDIIEEIRYVKNILFYSSTLLHSIAKPGTNVALNKKASQSSLLRSEYPAERAVDGNTGTILYPRQECTHTDLEYEPWWKVDLGDTYVISHVTVINRGDCCGERLRNFMVRVGPFEDFRENTPCGDIYSDTPSDGETIDVRCAEPISGRWVSVQLIGREDYLSLCEVQVFSESG